MASVLHDGLPAPSVVLHDRCPGCAEPVQVLKLVRQGRKLGCPHCGTDISRAAANPATDQDLSIQNWFLQIAEAGWVDLPGHGPLYGIAFFQLALILMRLVTGCAHARALRLCLAATVRERHETGQIPLVREVDLLTPDRRRLMLRQVAAMLESWPRRFVEACQTAKISQGHLIKSPSQVPFIYWATVTGHLSASLRRIEGPELQAGIQYLRQHGVAPTYAALNTLFDNKFVSGSKRFWSKNCGRKKCD